MPRNHDSSATASPNHASSRDIPMVCVRTSMNASAVNPARKSGFPSQPNPTSSRLKASYTTVSPADAMGASACITKPLISATPVKKIMPTAMAPQAKAFSQCRISIPPAASISRPPSTQRTNPMAIATWIGPHNGVDASTEACSNKPRDGSGCNASPTATSTPATASA